MSLQVWLPLTEDLHNQGLKNISVSSNNSSVSTNGKIGSCMKITSNTDLGYSHDFNTTGVSFGGWFKFNKSEISSVVSNLTYNSTANSPTGNLIGNNYYGGIGLIWTGNNYYSSNNFSSMTIQSILRTSSTIQNTSGFYVDFDVWVHIFLTWDPDAHALNLYKNGILFNTKTSVEFSDGVTRNILLNYNAIWGGNGPSASIPMYCNDIRIYDHALSPLEVKHLAQGLVLHYPLNRGGFGGDNIIAGTSPNEIQYTYPSSGYSDKFSPITTVVPTASQYTLSFWAKSTVDGDRVTSHFYSPNTTTTCVSSQGVSKTAVDGHMPFTLSTNWEYYWVTYTQTETTAVKHVIFPRMGAVGNPYSITSGTGTISVKCVKLEEGSTPTPWVPNQADALYTKMGLDNNIVYDTSGYGNNGELYAYDANGSITVESDTPRYNVSTHIASANSTTSAASGTRYIYGHCSLTNPTEMTVSFWLKPVSGGYGGTTSNGQGYFCTTNYEYGNANVGSDYQASAMNHRDGAVDINDSSSTTQCRPTFYPTIGEWHHYVITYDGQVGRVYKDGVQSSTAQFSSPKTLDSFIGVIIGFSKAGGVWRRNDACYSDFRIYTTALSADDVMALYKNAGYVDSDGNVYAYEMTE